MVGAAHWAHTNRIRANFSATVPPASDAKALKVTTYGVALASAVPTIQIPVPGSSPVRFVTIQPTARTYNGGTASRTLQLIREGLEYGEHDLSQLDLKFSKRFTMDRYRVRFDFDVYNVFNSSWPFTVSSAYSTAPASNWLRPTNVLQARFVKLGMQFEF
jgi:hypothetical protein